MAGIGSYYYVGSAGGFLGTDGLNSTAFKIAVWHADCMSLVVDYKSYDFKPIALSLKSFIPKGPNDPNMLREAMILFASNLFESCPSFSKVAAECEGIESMDLNSGYNVPEHFSDLLEESKQIDISEKVHIFFANLEETKL